MIRLRRVGMARRSRIALKEGSRSAMLESGKIKQIGGNTMLVEFERSAMCEKCGACERAQKAMLMEVERIGNAAIGDRVEVELPAHTLLQAAFVAYGIPLILLLVGLLVGARLPSWLGFPGNSDLYAAGLGLLLAGGAFLALRLTEKKRCTSGKYAPKVVHVECLCQRPQQNDTNE